MDELTGEYQIVLYRENHLDKFDVEVEKRERVNKPEEGLAVSVRTKIKSLVGVSRRVRILEENTLERTTHKAKRVVDKRQKVWSD